MSHSIQANFIKKASKYQLWNMPKEIKRKALKNLELLQMDDTEKKRHFQQKLQDKYPKLIEGLNDGSQRIPAYMVF